MLGMEIPVSGVWAGTRAAESVTAPRRAKMRRVRLVIRLGAPAFGAWSSTTLALTGDRGTRTIISGDGEGVFEAGALGGEHFAAVFGEVPVVFEADAELADDVDAGFVGEAHAGRERGGVCAEGIGPFV